MPLPPAPAAALAWWAAVAGTLSPGDPTILPPGPRNRSHDFVVKGYRMDPAHIALAAELHRGFVRVAGDALPDAGSAAAAASPVVALGFAGSGIVILGGMPPYLTPTLVTLRALRRTGCALPVEVWFPEAEAPSAEIAAGLARLGARACVFPVPGLLGNVSFPP